MNIQQLYSIYKENPVISTDTRKLSPGSMFFALKGENFNGNTFAEKAIEQGCAYAVVDEREYKYSDKYILVDNVLGTLQELAKHHRKSIQFPVIGITGSNGKTTTKELISSVLSKKHKVYATKGNLNNHIGVPLSILELTHQHEIAIIEMGANHVGEIASLSNISMPTHGIITNIGKAHLEGFGGIEGVIKGKTELYNYLRNNEGIVFLNESDELLTEKAKEIESVTYGIGKGEINGKINETTPYLSVNVNGKVFQTQLTGAYNAENVLAAICIGNFFGVKWEDMQEAIASYNPTNNRSQIIKTKKNTVIMDAYNANPVSMKAAIENLNTTKGDKKAAILGGMRELGEYQHQEHQKIVDELKKLKLEKVILVGNEFDECIIPEDYLLFNSNDSVLKHLKKQPISNCVVLVKGSRGIQLEKVLDEL